VNQPALFPVLAQLLTKYRDTGYPLDLGKLAITLWEICHYHCRFQQGFEVAWALWLAKLFQLVVPDQVCSEIATLDDPVVAIVALDLRDNGFVMNLDTSRWNNSMTGDDLYSQSWLLAYEAGIRNWLPSKNGDDYIAADPFFSDIQRLGVYFYDSIEADPLYQVCGKDIDVECQTNSAKVASRPIRIQRNARNLRRKDFAVQCNAVWSPPLVFQAESEDLQPMTTNNADSVVTRIEGFTIKAT
jgi:hypothetical protein